MKLRRYILSSFILGVSLVSTQAYAATVSDLQNSLNSANQQLQNSVQQKNALQSKLDDSQRMIDEVAKQMNENSQKLDSLNQQAAKITSQIHDNETKLNELQKIFNEQLTVMYEKGTVDYLNVLLDSTSFSDFLSRFELIRIIAGHNEDVMNEIKSLKLSLEKQQSQVQADLQSVKQKQQELAILQQTNIALQKQKQAEMASLQDNIDAEKKTVDYYQEQVAFAKQEAAMSQQQPVSDGSSYEPLSSRGSGGLVTASASQIISIATQYEGVPYVWGGTSPSGFDCSGFTQYVFGKAGISLNRTAAGQFAQGTSVSESNLQPGDLVFFSTYGPGATHVGIYMGSGMFINAEDSGVRVSSLSNSYWGPRYIGARRIL